MVSRSPARRLVATLPVVMTGVINPIYVIIVLLKDTALECASGLSRMKQMDW